MAYCNKCGKEITWIKDGPKWIPLDNNPKEKNYRLNHIPVCVPDPKYIEKRNKLMNSGIKKEPRLQIDENTFV